MKLRWAVVAVLFAAPVCAFAQSPTLSLAELARQEELRRKGIKQPAKVYTANDLRGPIIGPEAAAPAAAGAVAEAPPAGAPVAAAAAGEAKDQKYWKDRIDSARVELDRSKVYLDALQSRINALTTDFVNRDDPAQRRVIEADRTRALAELDRLKTQIQVMTKGVADIEEEARKLGVPPGWLR